MPPAAAPFPLMPESTSRPDTSPLFFADHKSLFTVGIHIIEPAQDRVIALHKQAVIPINFCPCERNHFSAIVLPNQDRIKLSDHTIRWTGLLF